MARGDNEGGDVASQLWSEIVIYLSGPAAPRYLSPDLFSDYLVPANSSSSGGRLPYDPGRVSWTTGSS